MTDAHYDFLEDLIAAERAISLYPFIEPNEEVNALLDGLERELARQPHIEAVRPKAAH